MGVVLLLAAASLRWSLGTVMANRNADCGNWWANEENFPSFFLLVVGILGEEREEKAVCTNEHVKELDQVWLWRCDGYHTLLQGNILLVAHMDNMEQAEIKKQYGVRSR